LYYTNPYPAFENLSHTSDYQSLNQCIRCRAGATVRQCGNHRLQHSTHASSNDIRDAAIPVSFIGHKLQIEAAMIIASGNWYIPGVITAAAK
jgi:hypothetical protein